MTPALLFQLDSAMVDDVIINIGVGGSATNGVDYDQIDSIITIPAGQTSATIIIDAVADGLVEGQEIIELYYQPSPCAPYDTVFLYIDDYTPLEFTVDPTNITCNGCLRRNGRSGSDGWNTTLYDILNRLRHRNGFIIHLFSSYWA